MIVEIAVTLLFVTASPSGHMMQAIARDAICVDEKTEWPSEDVLVPRTSR
jgi:hypothetical protein